MLSHFTTLSERSGGNSMRGRTRGRGRGRGKQYGPEKNKIEGIPSKMDVLFYKADGKS